MFIIYILSIILFMIELVEEERYFYILNECGKNRAGNPAYPPRIFRGFRDHMAAVLLSRKYIELLQSFNVLSVGKDAITCSFRLEENGVGPVRQLPLEQVPEEYLDNLNDLAQETRDFAISILLAQQGIEDLPENIEEQEADKEEGRAYFIDKGSPGYLYFSSRGHFEALQKFFPSFKQVKRGDIFISGKFAIPFRGDFDYIPAFKLEPSYRLVSAPPLPDQK